MWFRLGAMGDLVRTPWRRVLEYIDLSKQLVWCRLRTNCNCGRSMQRYLTVWRESCRTTNQVNMTLTLRFSRCPIRLIISFSWSNIHFRSHRSDFLPTAPQSSSFGIIIVDTRYAQLPPMSDALDFLDQISICYAETRCSNISGAWPVTPPPALKEESTQMSASSSTLPFPALNSTTFPNINSELGAPFIGLVISAVLSFFQVFLLKRA